MRRPSHEILQTVTSSKKYWYNEQNFNRHNDGGCEEDEGSRTLAISRFMYIIYRNPQGLADQREIFPGY